jgi:translocation and assembly module TamA
MRRAWAAALLALLLGGCASLPWGGAKEPAAEPGSAAAEVPAGPPAVRVEIDAPPPLRALLETHLDLVRLGALVRGNMVDATEWSRLIDATPAQVRALLETEGFFEPLVDIERGPVTAAGLPASVRVVVSPGSRSKVKQLTLEFEGELQTAADAGDTYAQGVLDALRSNWALPVGAPFVNGRWSEAKSATLAQLRAAGFASATWSGTAAAVDAERESARLFLVADSGPLFRFGGVTVDGLAAHDEETVRNLAAMAPGTPLTERQLVEYQERLQRVGLFDGVTVTLNADPASAPAAMVNVRVREAPLQVYTFGVGYDINTKARVTVEHVYRRVFGLALSANNKVEFGQVRQAWDGELSTHPGPTLYRNLVGGAIERLESSDDVVLSQRVRVGRAKDTQSVNRLMFVEAERSSRTTDISEVDTNALSGNYHVIWRRLDSLLLPTEGYTFSLQAGAGYARGSDTPNGWFQRAYGRLTYYRPLGGLWFGQARVEAGEVFAPAGVVLPDSQLFRAGGDDSVRGYSYRTLGPVVDGATASGKVLATTSVELARPVSAKLPSVWGAVFVDAGNAANSFGSFDAVFGYGVGVRWRSPVGPLRIDAAWADELRALRLHFSLGVIF